MGKTGLATVIGHVQARKALSAAIENGRLAQAYLFVGPSGVGKRALALALLQEVFSDPLKSPDVLFLERETDDKTGKLKKDLSVEQIREAVERLSMTAITGGKKAVVLEEAGRMSIGAANSLLKTLEEPRGDALLILCAESVESVPATVASRCQLIRLHPVPRAEMEEALRKRGLSGKEAGEIARLSAGRPGVALSIIQDAGYRAELGLAASSLASLKGEGIAGRLRMAGDLLPKDEANKPVLLERLFDAWEQILRDDLLQSILGNDRDPTPIAHTLRTLGESRNALRRNVNPQLALERVLLTL